MSEVPKHFYFFWLEDEQDKFSLYVYVLRNFNFLKIANVRLFDTQNHF